MKIALTFFLLFTVGAIRAESLVECVDPDVARTLLGYPGRGDLEIDSGIPAGTPIPDLPDSLALIGSRATRGTLLVAYRSPDSPIATEQALRAEPQVGWTIAGDPAYQRFGGFQERRPASVTSALAFCSDSYGNANLTVTPTGDKGSYVTVMVYPGQQTLPCGNNKRSRLMLGDPIDVPVLFLPEGIKMLSGGGTTSGSHRGTMISAVMSASLPMATVLADFGEQLNKQGWKLDGAWSGNIAQGSSWVGPQDDSYGMLSITALGGEAFKAVFHAMSLDEPKANPTGVTTSFSSSSG